MTFVLPVFSMAQHKRTFSAEQYSQLIKLRAAVKADMGSLKAHEAFISAWGGDTTILAQYRVWMKKYPKNAVIPFAIGKDLSNFESPSAAEFLLKAVQLNPKLAEAWSLLGYDAGMRGDVNLSDEYAKKAMLADSLNARYVFDYAWSVKKTDSASYQSIALNLIKRFPDSEVGVKALYWLADEEQDVNKKIGYFELLKSQSAKSKSSWYSAGIEEYYLFMLFRDPQKALEIAGIDKIPVHKKLADTLIRVNSLLREGKTVEANLFLQPIKVSSAIGVNKPFLLLKAKVADAANDTRAAYDTIARYYSRKPDDTLRKALFAYADKIGLKREIVAADIKKLRDLKAKQADDFSLYNYQTKTNSSLSDYKGKLILLTYWFPGCGPCRREMPYFESVLKGFDRKDIVYLGLNLQQEQDAMVLPFLQSTGYTFIPLRDSWHRKAGNLQASGAPTNFIIDQDGKVVFSNFMIDENNTDMLRLMIGELIDDHKKNNRSADTSAGK